VAIRRPQRQPQRQRTAGGWWVDGLLLAGFVGLTLALANGWLLDADLAVRDWVDAHRPAPAYWTARALNMLGQGGLVLLPLSALLGLAVMWRHRVLWPVLPVASALLLTGVTIGPLKYWLDRGYPHNWALPHPEELFSDPVGGTAYPSGHVANAIVWYGVMALFLRALAAVPDRAILAVRLVPPVVVFCVTTYLGFHWLTDSIAGLLLGLSLDRLLVRARWADPPWVHQRLPEWWGRGGFAPARRGIRPNRPPA
jgi:membrane-associated phospholipid phosphatase